MTGYALMREPELGALIAELQKANTDTAGLRRAIANLQMVPRNEVGITVAFCWITCWGQDADSPAATRLRDRLLADKICTTDELREAVTAWTVCTARDTGYLQADLFDRIHADPYWAGALHGVTRLPDVSGG